MAKDDLYSFDDKSIDFNTSDLDDIISNDEILKNFKDDSKESLIFDEDKIGSLKEEPVLESLDSLEQKEDVLSPAAPAEPEPAFPGNDEKILFSDESGSPVSLDAEEKPLIVHDQETEQFVQEEISREIKTEKEMSQGPQAAGVSSGAEQKSVSSFFEEDEDETISLSSDELSNILEDTEEADLTAVPTVDEVLSGREKSPEISLDVPEETDLAGLKEEPVAGGEISLDEIPMEQIDLPPAPSGSSEESPAFESKPEEQAGSFFEEDEDESIGLTNSELDNILKSSEIVEEKPVEEEGEGMGLAQGASLDARAGMDREPDKLKKILKYLDGLLDYLPEEKIKEFAESEYYELYHSLFEDLKI